MLFFIKKKTPVKIFLALLFFMPYYAAAQNNANSIFKKYADTAMQWHDNKKPYYIIFSETTMPAHVKVVRTLGEHIAIIELADKSNFDAVQQKITIAAANNNWKFSPALEKNIATGNTKTAKYILTGLDTDALIAALQQHNKAVVIIKTDTSSHSVVVQCNATYLKQHLLSLKEIIFIDEYTVPQTEVGIIGYNRSFHGINLLDYAIANANGKNIVAGIKENKMDDADLDIYKRVLPSSIASTQKENHATIIASIIGGAGNSFYDGRGVANACTFFSSTFANLFADDAAVLNQNKITVQNHSYGTIPQQFYGAEAVSYDVQTWQNKNILHVFSAGNKGLAAATEGRYINIANYANITGNFKMAKNIITVGAIDGAGNVAAESSAGPLYDGRLAPQLMALGPNGTSDAAAIVSGTIAVLQQVYADSNSQAIPPAALIKALLFNTAEDIYKTGIDYKTGYGVINSYAAVKALQQKKYDGGTLAQGQVWTKNISVPVNTAQLKITLAWTDSAATVNSNKAIINDLDIEVQELASGIIYKPWVLSAAATIDSLVKLPVQKRDSLNTAEQINIALPAAGNYQIKVSGTAVFSPVVAFNIAYNTDTLNTFAFTSPQHAADVNREENPATVIKWKTFIADTNTTGNLYISYNSGTNWQLIQPSLKIYTRQYTWPIKDTNSVAILKMETGFGNFLSTNFIISKVNRPNVDFVCADSFQLSWNKHVYANGYKIFALTDSAYLKHILTVTDTFKVFKRTDYPSLVYAVEPVLNNNLPAVRSIALNIELQGVNCFYKTLNYNLLDGNEVNLILELSIAAYVDSVYFESVTAQGQLLQTYGGTKVNSATLIYTRFVNNLATGTTYFRCKIKLKSGVVVYTNIVDILTSGKKKIVFYPNPASRSQPLQFVLQQGLTSSTILQLFDVTGQLVKSYTSLSGSIAISNLSSGLLIYKLVSTESKVLETGKIIIQ